MSGTLGRIIAIALVSSAAACGAARERVFTISSAARNVEEFRAMAKVAARLKPYGRVRMSIGAMADKSRHEMPPGGSSWHEYTANHGCLWKFFPHPKIAPFVPAGFVAANRALLLKKATVLRELGLEGSFFSNDTHFLPEAFFGQYPHLRGPRLDHPRRSRKEEFSWCVDLPETREMIEWMAAELIRNVPEIKALTGLTNDSGSGLCWGAALYSGPNGPRHCASRNAGVRLRDLILALQRGAEKAGGKLEVGYSGNFWQNEEDVVLPLLPPDSYLSRRDPAGTGTGSLINEVYPVLGLVNPLAILASMERLGDPRVWRVGIGVTQYYGDGAEESPETLSRVIDVMKSWLDEPVKGMAPRFHRLEQLAAKWAGPGEAPAAFEAFQKMDEAFRLKAAVAPRYRNVYVAVSARQLTRPLVVKPDLLSPDEEDYFLPFVFNIHPSEARNDYIDLHGARITGPAQFGDAGIAATLAAGAEAARLFEALDKAPEREWFRQLAVSMRMWASALRTMHNFHIGQMVRDRNAKVLAGGPRIPDKTPTWTGDPDYLEWMQVQRDEFDNANELLALIEQRGGRNWFARARKAEDEGAFLLGPDVAGALRKKAGIMRAHWLDAQKYLASPLK